MHDDLPMMLPAPARYRPWSKGLYEVIPALRPFGTDFGNAELDGAVFQFDESHRRFLTNKIEAYHRKALHVGSQDLSQQVMNSVRVFVRDRLRIDGGIDAPADESLDALMLRVPEDLAVVSTRDGTDWISYVNVCAPSHWDPSTKLGQSFFEGHQVVPGFDRINRGASGLVHAMVHNGPWVRFVWGLETDDRLNHHPVPLSSFDPIEWHGRKFNTMPLVARFERQVIWGLPEVSAAVFVIRVGFLPHEEVIADPALSSAVRSMTPEALRYKGFDREYDGLLEQLEAERHGPVKAR